MSCKLIAPKFVLLAIFISQIIYVRGFTWPAEPIDKILTLVFDDAYDQTSFSNVMNELFAPKYTVANIEQLTIVFK